jgi:ArsR family transcriptional regulator
MDAARIKRYERQARVVQSLAHPLRLAIAEFLKGGEQCVCDIAEHVGAERSNVSRHLGIMLRSGILHTRKEGVMVFYGLRTPCILDFLGCASNVLRHNLKEDAKALR